MQDHRKLEVWQRSMALAVRLYEFAAALPAEERYNLASQLRSAAISVPLNVAEGAGSSTNAEFARFLGYGYRSLKEASTCIELAPRLYTVLPLPAAQPVLDEIDQVARMVRGLITRLNAVPNRPGMKTADDPPNAPSHRNTED